MKSNYKKLGQFIRVIDIRNKEDRKDNLLGVSTRKVFIDSVANTVGTDFKKYKIVRKNQFTYVSDTSRRGEKMGIAMLETHEQALVSQAYTVFEVADTNKLSPEYLMMWFRRPEFDRYARFKSHGSVREIFDWEEMSNIELPVPAIEKQREIVREYNVVNDRIALNKKLTQTLEDTAQAIYKQWFVNFDIPNELLNLRQSEFSDFPQIPEGWSVKRLDQLTSKIGSGSTPRGGKGAYKDEGISLIRSMNVHDYRFIQTELAHIDDNQAKKLANVEVQSEDVLLNITGVSVARCCVAPEYVLPARVNQHVIIIRPSQPISYYLQCCLASPQYKSRLLGTSEGASTRQALTKRDLEEFLILIPKDNVLTRFEHHATAIFLKIETLAQTSQKLSELRAIILSRLATS